MLDIHGLFPLPRKPKVDETRMKELEQHVTANDKRIRQLNNRLRVAEIRLGIYDPDADVEATGK